MAWQDASNTLAFASMGYDHRAIEQRWQTYWETHETFRTTLDLQKPKYYVLDMFPYPSGDGLHVGHAEGYTATDIVARYKRMRGYNVLHPMGWDAFGLPAERFAMKTGTHPSVRTAECAANFRAQLKRLGFSYDWQREINTTSPDYVRWTQWIFLRLWGSWYDADARRARPIEALPIPSDLARASARELAEFRDRHRLAYLHEAAVNWCPELRIVLANEEVAEYVEQGYEVVRKPMRQWMLRITAYAERLLEDLEGLDWPASVLEMQRHWIGRSDGAEIEFEVAEHPDLRVRVFTTRPDTLPGATYLVLAPEHPLVERLTMPAQRTAVEAYLQRTAHRSERERQAASVEGEKTGVPTGSFAQHPTTGAPIPIWIADYVLVGYGTGAIMAVPAHDERDHAFARAMDLPIVQVVAPMDGTAVDVQRQAFVGEGINVNSGQLDGLPTAQAKTKMTATLEASGLGRRRTTFKLRDWLFSRQRYWGEPFPLIYAPDGTVEAVPDEQLPVPLPQVEDFSPSENGDPPLAKAEGWRNLPGGYSREVNTMPQWAGSCWYYLRFCDPGNDSVPWASEAERYWMPVDLYVGGVEHAVLHLLYSRFWHKVLFDLGYVSTREPFQRLVNQGMILGATFVPLDRRRGADGKPVMFLPDQVERCDTDTHERWRVKDTQEAVEIQWDKMSKSRGNVVNPDQVVADYGADTVRLYEMFMGPLEHSAPWQSDGVVGVHRFLQRVYRLFFDSEEHTPKVDPEGTPNVVTTPDTLRPLGEGEGTERQRRLLHRTIQDVTDRLDRLAFNTAISALMVFVRDIQEPNGDPLPRIVAEQLCLLLAPFAPHLAEQLWYAMGKSASLAYEPWPAADERWLLEHTFSLVVQVNGKKRAEIEVPVGASEEELATLAKAAREVEQHLAGRVPRRVVVVPGRLVNIVV